MINKIIGNKGEKEACKYLKKNGYEILERNYTKFFGEIDIICKKDDVIAFVEVKSRKNDDYGYAADYVTKSKQEKIIKTAKAYISTNSLHNYYFRFDVIEIYFEDFKINHIENAF